MVLSGGKTMFVKSVHKIEFCPHLVEPKPSICTSHTEPVKINVSDVKSSTIHNINEFDCNLVVLDKPHEYSH